MTVTTTLVTMTGSAQLLSTVAVPPNLAGGGGVAKILIEPLRTNGAVMSIGDSTVTIDGTGVGVITELSIPSATLMDRYLLEDQSGENTLSPSQFYIRGTNNQKCKVSYFQR